MLSVLAKANILPGQEYNVTDIHDAVKNSLNKRPIIKCIVDKESQASILYGIRICFKTNLELIDCDGPEELRKINGMLTDCNFFQPVRYPTELPHHFLDRIHDN